jgi:predicted RNA-binding Zn ribbon-like protein
MAGTDAADGLGRNDNQAIQATGDDSEGFVFVGDALAIDFVNTQIVVRRRLRDLLTSAGAYAAWWRQAAATYPTLSGRLDARLAEIDAEAFAAAVELRAALRELFGAVADGMPLPSPALARLNRALATVHDEIAVGQGGTPHAVVVPHATPVDGPLAAVARSALDVLTEQDASRIHRCANPHCVLLFRDTTKSATRRWCSLACRNRARSSERYRARKDGAGA